MKKKICFIVNPISGVGRQKIIEKLIDTVLDKHVYDYEIAYTKAAKHATEIAKDAADRHFDVIVAVGGDGSVNEVSRGLIGSKSAMAIIPTGSGNGLARHLRIPLNLKRAMRVINNGNLITIDTIKINEESFVNVAGVGFDAHIGWEFAKFGKRGFTSYLKVVRREFFKYKVQDFEVIADGKVYNKTAFLISIANGTQWGNNAYIAPKANIADGLIDIVILNKVSFWKSLVVGYRLFNKKLDNASYLDIIKCKEAIIRQSKTIAHVDGEPVEVGRNLTINIFPQSLNVIVP